MRDRTPQLLIAVFTAVAAAAFVLPDWAKFLLTITVAKGVVVLGLVILMRTGLISFGQGLYYCIGAYAAGLAAIKFGITSVPLLILAGVAASAAISFLFFGFLLANYRGIFFGLLSLALSMILYGLLVKSQELGSSDGFNVFKPGAAPGRSTLLVASAAVALVAGLLVHRYLRTRRSGALAEAIRDNEIRVEYMGASVRNAIHVKYVIAAVLAGLGGSLAGIAVGHIDPEMAYWTMSGEFVFIAILAGTGSVLAPFLGALIYGVVHTVAFEASPHTWQMVLGASLLACIWFLPDGVWSLFRRRKAG